ncbi:MAG: hypothetical protein MUF15_12875 [Acidobacteria bacterium]|nr:hypothetical protein [Acidobacteriota bacterium]
MKKYSLLIIIIIASFLFTHSLSGAPIDIKSLFPQLNGWTQKGNIDIYNPDNLYEYIDGAADVFLSYDFQELATASFETKPKGSFTVDIYRHGNNKNGFGIYSQEKPAKGPFIAIGAQGYYEKGVLNFLAGPFYIKIAGFDLGDRDETILKEAAQQIAQKIQGDLQFPQIVSCFPLEEKIENSERYAAESFMGHSFLHSAFTADYGKEGRKIQVFIIETNDEKETRKMLDDYLNFVKSKGMTVENPGQNFYRFQDPYYRSSGMMNIKQSGNYLWGLFYNDNAAAGILIDKIQENLLKLKLIIS